MQCAIKSVQSGNVIDHLDVSQLATCISLQKIVYCSYRKSWRAIEVTSNNHIHSEISLQINIFYLMRQFNTLLTSIFIKEYFISLICSLQTQWSLDQSYQILSGLDFPPQHSVCHTNSVIRSSRTPLYINQNIIWFQFFIVYISLICCYASK